MEEVWFDFNELLQRMDVKIVEVKLVAFGEEGCWNDLVEGYTQFRRRKENKSQAEESVDGLRDEKERIVRESCAYVTRLLTCS